MNIVIPPIVVEKGEAFEQDLLNRKEFGRALLNLVNQSKNELVISLDGQWGEGKTTFVKMWQGLLYEKEIPNVYINAFSNDHVDDAFIAVASAITAYVEKNSVTPDEEKTSEFKTKAISVGVQLLSWSAKVGVKAATLGAIKDSDIEDLKDIKGDLSKGVSDIAGDFVKERLTSHAEDIKTLESFKIALSKIPTLLTPDGKKPLVIIIDELDRCKPTYAVELIEKVKHLFSVKNVVFLLVMHKKQLEEAVKCVYGQNIDSHTYLQKFINIETSLPKRIGDKYANDLAKYSEHLFDLHQIDVFKDPENIISYISALANHFNLSLRQLERVYTNLALYYASVTKNHINLMPIISFLAVIKVVKPHIYEALSLENISYEEVFKETELSDEEAENNDSYAIQYIGDWIKFSLMTANEFSALDSNNLFHRFSSELWQSGTERNRLFPIYAKKMSLFKML